MGERKYRDERWLREKYWDEEMSTSEIGEVCDVTPSTIARWLRRHGIERRSFAGTSKDQKYRDEDWLRTQLEGCDRSLQSIADDCDVAGSTIRDWANRFDIETPDPDTTPPKLQDQEWLREQYVERQRSTTAIADEVGCSNVTVGKWLRRYDIGTRSLSEATLAWQLRTAPMFVTNEYGYEYWHTSYGGEEFHVPVHRLVAVSEYGFGAVAGKVVHHKNNIPFDNRSENLALMDRSDHTSHHMDSQYGERPWRDEDHLQNSLESATPEELAGEWDCNKQTIQEWIRRHDIDYSYDPNEGAPWRDEETLRDAYRTATRDELAERWGCSRTTIDNWLAKFDISASDVRDESEQRPLSSF